MQKGQKAKRLWSKLQHLGEDICKPKESVLTYNISVWYGHLTLLNKNRLSRVVKMGGKIRGRPQKPLYSLYRTAVDRKTTNILDDPTHPLHSEFELLPSGRRYRDECSDLYVCFCLFVSI